MRRGNKELPEAIVTNQSISGQEVLHRFFYNGIERREVPWK
jgi:hypothetical protein